MDLHQRTLRVGICAILCGILFRLLSDDLPERIWNRLKQPDSDTSLTSLETGHTVRFSPSSEVFSPDFAESPPAAGREPEKTVLPSFSDPESVALYYASSASPDVEALLARPLTWQLRGEEPTVLILHTHTTESYTKTKEPYVESARWRTLDEGYNMLSIGELVADKLEENGIRVIHDRTVHDYPSYNGSYVHARKSIGEYLEEYPSVKLILDLHRDASEGSGGQLRPTVKVGQKVAARLMLVLGTNHEAYEENLSLALKLHAQLEREAPGITRPLQLRGQRFNQDLSPGAVLVEVGAAGNTREEALLAAEILARAVAVLANGTN